MNFTFDPASRTPVYLQLAQEIKRQIAKGVLLADAQLPPVRELAMQLLINPNTVQKVYNELTREGILYSRRGVGVFVAEMTPSLGSKEGQHRAGQAAETLITDCLHLGLSRDEILKLIKERLKDFVEESKK